MCLHRKIIDFIVDELKTLAENSQSKIVRLEVSIDHDIEPLHWLSQQKSIVKTYWSDRHDRFEMAGVGSADLVFSREKASSHVLFKRLRKFLSCKYSCVRYYGGICFSQNQIASYPWQDFGNHFFLVPKFEVFKDQAGTYLALNLLLHHSDNANKKIQQTLQELAAINFNLPHQQCEKPQLSKRVDFPNQLQWYNNVNKGLTYLDQGILEKVVLARQTEFTIVDSCQPEHLLSLIQKEQNCSFQFCFQLDRDKAFIGSTPERLYWRQSSQIQTEAIAGTRPRGASYQEDNNFAKELLSSPKEIREHKLVLKGLQETLSTLCHQVNIAEDPNLLRLNQVQHLYSHCSGILNPEISDADIINQLHPTPAVGGYPRQKALELIASLETFSRGFYASPIGWVALDSAEFLVSIRSGLIQRNKLILFAGAGIISDSQPEAEWEELENKIRNFLQVVSCQASVDIV